MTVTVCIIVFFSSVAVIRYAIACAFSEQAVVGVDESCVGPRWGGGRGGQLEGRSSNSCVAVSDIHTTIIFRQIHGPFHRRAYGTVQTGYHGPDFSGKIFVSLVQISDHTPYIRLVQQYCRCSFPTGLEMPPLLLRHKERCGCCVALDCTFYYPAGCFLVACSTS